MIKKLSFVFILFTLSVACKNQTSNTEEIDQSSQQSIEKIQIDSSLVKFGIDSEAVKSLGGMNIGDDAPDFTASVLDSKTFSLSETLKEQEVLLVFYRGYWCGYCQKHLAELEDHLADFEEKGIKVIAITPESPEYAEKSIEKSNLSIAIIPDIGFEIMKKYNVLFEVNDYYLEKLAGYEIDYDKDPITGKTFFPVPATYLIGKDGKIKFAHFDPDYSKRSDVEKLLNID